MNTYIYDIEVFQDDWIVIFSRPELDAPYRVIHNNNYELREFMSQPDIIVGGFNNKHYDDYIIMVMLAGGSNIEVKRANDYIINGGKGWEIPFIQYQKKPFKSFDLKDDIADPGLSLKAIEGNLRLPIVESSVPFDIDRKLTEEELAEVIKYCKYDVRSTKRLYWERKKNYLDAKVLAGNIYNIAPADALGYTNARLSAIALEARYKERTDERDYHIPDRLPKDKIPEIVLDFFMQIRDNTIPDAKLFGAGKGSKGETLDIMLRTGGGDCPVTYAWGGVHGAPPCITLESDKDHYLFMDDVGSLYPNSMINFKYTSRSMSDPDAYKKLVELRLNYKAEAKKANKYVSNELGATWYADYSVTDENGDTSINMPAIKKDASEAIYERVSDYLDYNSKQASLKLIINTCYGAMLAPGNGLSDRRNGRSVCITNQLAMTVLIVMLAEACPSIWFFNINTDGIGYKIHRDDVPAADRVIKDWCENITGFTMERTEFKKFIQKDVNNYIGITPGGKLKTKGGYVSLYKGGTFKTNSLSIIHKAIVNYLVHDIPAEKTIKDCKDITSFQNIIKTGGTYEGSYQYVNGERTKLQKVNRVYAVKNKSYGHIVKGKWITEKRRKNKATGKMEATPVDPPVWSETVISECPEHAYVDNENHLTVEDLNLNYYIDMAEKRIDKYINIDSKVKRKIEKINKEVAIMATKKAALTEEKRVEMNIYSKLSLARKKWLDKGVKPTGKNTYAQYKYFTLEDIEPAKQAVFQELGLVDVFVMGSESATLTLINSDKPEESIKFTMPVVMDQSLIKNPIQSLGATRTYLLRYLYLTMLDILEIDLVELNANRPEEPAAKAETPAPAPAPQEKPVRKKPATEVERKEITKELVKKDEPATETQKEAIRKGLMKLRDKETDLDYEPYITDVVLKMRKGVTKSEADSILIETGNKLNE